MYKFFFSHYIYFYVILIIMHLFSRVIFNFFIFFSFDLFYKWLIYMYFSFFISFITFYKINSAWFFFSFFTDHLQFIGIQCRYFNFPHTSFISTRYCFTCRAHGYILASCYYLRHAFHISSCDFFLKGSNDTSYPHTTWNYCWNSISCCCICLKNPVSMRSCYPQLEREKSMAVCCNILGAGDIFRWLTQSGHDRTVCVKAINLHQGLPDRFKAEMCHGEMQPAINSRSSVR